MEPKREKIEINISVKDQELLGDLYTSDHPRAVIIFAHGSGSSRKSPRNRYVAKALNQRGFTTLLFDLLTSAEECERSNVFDIELLTERLNRATSWVRNNHILNGLPIAYFGASTGAAAALAAASQNPHIYAVVSRGGRPDLAWQYLKDVKCPVLLIVGEHDSSVEKLNQAAKRRLSNAHIEVIPGATHLFEEYGALDKVIDLAYHWFDSNIYKLNRKISLPLF